MATDLKQIELPDYAIIYLTKMCEAERKRLNYLVSQTGDMNMQLVAAYESLNAIECAI